MSASEATPAPSHLAGSGLQGIQEETGQPVVPDIADDQMPGSSRASPLKKNLLYSPKKEVAQGDYMSMSSERQPTQSPSSVEGSSMAGFSPTLSPQSHYVSHQRPSSPTPQSAASSMIFERNVQESTNSSDIAPGIPAHIKTEDQIPPALEASSLAITDDHLGPEEVEIVTHIGHQPAAAALAHNITSTHQSDPHLPLARQDSQPEQQIFHSQHEFDEAASSYGALDPSDVRRLSFISFADVVHAEHAESNSNQSIYHSPLSGIPTDSSFSQSSPKIRPISPTRSPLSSHSHPFSPAVTTPPTSGSGPGSAKGVELSPARSQTGSPLATSPHQHGELSIETLSQALRATASRDLSGFSRSPPSSAI